MRKTAKKMGLLLTTALIFLSSCAVDLLTSYDVVILGGGLSAMVAAVELANQGKSVMIVEESSILGGNKLRIDDGVMQLNGTLQQEQGIEDNEEAILKALKESHLGKDNYFFNVFVSELSQNNEWLQSQGVQLDELVALPGNGKRTGRITAEHMGGVLVRELEQKLVEQRVPIEYDSSIRKVSLGANGDHLVEIERSTTVFSVHAKALLIAEEPANMYSVATTVDLAKLNGEHPLPKLETSSGEHLLQSLGADYANSGEAHVVATYNSAAARLVTPLLRTFGAPLVNIEGQRFVNEMISAKGMVDAILKQPGQFAYLIYDDQIKSQIPYIAEYETNSVAYKAETLLELSQHTGIPEEQLYTLLLQHRESIVSGHDPVFDRNFDMNNAFADIFTSNASYYVIKVEPAQLIRSSYAYVSDKFEVLKQGTPLQGIYAIGDSAQGVYPKYELAGSELTYSLMMGRKSAAHIIAYIGE